MGKKNNLRIELRRNVDILKNRSQGCCRCSHCENLLYHSVTKTLGAIVLYYTFSISLTFFNQKFIQVKTKKTVIVILLDHQILGTLPTENVMTVCKKHDAIAAVNTAVVRH